MKTAVKKEIPIFYAITIVLAVFAICFLTVARASAEIIKQQTDNSTKYTYPGYNLNVETNLGTGLFGIPSSIDIKIDTGSLYSVAHTNESVVLYEFTDGTYTTLTGRYNESVRNTAGFGNSFPATIVNFEFASTTWELDPTKYYRLKIASNGNGNWFVGGTANYTGYPYGTTGTWTEGCYQCNNLTAVYFILYGSEPAETYENSITIVSPISTTTPSTNVDLYVNYFNDGLYDTLNFIGYYESDNWNTAFYSTTTAQTGLIVGDTVNVDLNTNSVVLWRAYLTSTATTTSPLYSGFEKFAVVSNPYPELIGVNDWDNSFDLATSTCSISNITGCFQNAMIFLFKPSQNAYQPFIDLKEDIQYKPPFGYFFAVKEVFDDFNATTTPAYTWEIQEVLWSEMLAPVKAGFGMILWLLFGFWVIRTLSKLQT